MEIKLFGGDLQTGPGSCQPPWVHRSLTADQIHETQNPALASASQNNTECDQKRVADDNKHVLAKGTSL
jgi:hypothetical protein